MKILVINAGSSSLKYQLFDMENEAVMAKGLCERIGINGSVLTHKPTGSEPVKYVEDMPDHVAAIKLVFKALTASNGGVIKDMSEINAVGHRVLHGGDKFSESIVIDEKVKAAIRECIPLGPLHNPANLMGIEACEKIMPDVPQVAVSIRFSTRRCLPRLICMPVHTNTMRSTKSAVTASMAPRTGSSPPELLSCSGTPRTQG